MLKTLFFPHCAALAPFSKIMAIYIFEGFLPGSVFYSSVTCLYAKTILFGLQ